MKDIKTYINEAVTKGQKDFFVDNFIKTFQGSKLTKDAIVKMFDNLDMPIIKSISDYLNKTDLKNYIAYCPTNDEFISDNNKDKIVNQIAEYIFKFLSN